MALDDSWADIVTHSMVLYGWPSLECDGDFQPYYYMGILYRDRRDGTLLFVQLEQWPIDVKVAEIRLLILAHVVGPKQKSSIRSAAAGKQFISPSIDGLPHRRAGHESDI